MILYASVLAWFSLLLLLLRLRRSPLAFALIPSYRTSLHRFRHPPQAIHHFHHTQSTASIHISLTLTRSSTALTRRSTFALTSLNRQHGIRPHQCNAGRGRQARNGGASRCRCCLHERTSPSCHLRKPLPRPCRPYADSLRSLDISVHPPFSTLPTASTAPHSSLAFE